MNRRNFLAASAATSAMALFGRNRSAEPNHSTAQAVRITVDSQRRFGRIPPHFVGLGYEISSIAVQGLLSGQNRKYIQLVRTLGPVGVIRIGGNTSDYSSFSRNGPAVSAPKGTVVSDSNLRQLGEFLNATGWKLIWGLNLGNNDEGQVVAESVAVAAAVRDKLLAFEIGNEPDLFGKGTAHRPKEYSYDDYLKEYRRYKAAVRAKLPNVRFAGPDVASATDWVSRFAAAEGSDLELLTHHYYRECAGPASTMDKLLRPDPKLAPQLEKLRSASVSSHVPYRICETNSFCGGGKPGVSNTFGGALWVLDFMFTLAYGRCAGVNMETGVNQLGFISSYSPIGDDQHGTYSAAPEYYGMLAFCQAARGEMVGVNCEAAGMNLTAYAVADDGRITVTILNKEASQDANVSMDVAEHFVSAGALRLTGPSLESTTGIMLGGAAATTRGTWMPKLIEQIRSDDGLYRLRVPAASAAIVYLNLHR